MRSTLFSIYKIALYVEPEDIVPVQVYLDTTVLVSHNDAQSSELGQRMGISRSLKWSVLPSCAYTTFPLKVGVNLYHWDPNSKDRVLVSNAFVSGHRSRCGRCGSCETNIKLGVATGGTLLKSCYFIPRFTRNDLRWYKI